MTSNSYFTLYNGIKIPVIGFGTWQIPNGKSCYESVSVALKSGYKHIDTALAYRNEPSVGRAFRDSGIERSEIFITSKLPAEIKNYDEALKNFESTMENIGLDYIDLYLIHAPWPWNRMGADFTKENIKVWKAMEEINKGGRCRAIGISNFNVKDVTAILDNCSIKPMVNQIKYYIGHTQEEVTEFCKKNDILLEGYSPLATGKILENEKLTAIAQKYNSTVPQICIRYVLQREVLPLPKSTHPEYIRQNFDVDFEISAEDMELLSSLKNTVRV
jgi:diketogulonate reductase-like aldo/keto reductase